MSKCKVTVDDISDSGLAMKFVTNTHEDFYNFISLLCPTSITSGITAAETLLMIFPLE